MDKKTKGCIDYLKQCCKNGNIGDISIEDFDIDIDDFIKTAYDNNLEFYDFDGTILRFEEGFQKN